MQVQHNINRKKIFRRSAVSTKHFQKRRQEEGSSPKGPGFTGEESDRTKEDQKKRREATKQCKPSSSDQTPSLTLSSSSSTTTSSRVSFSSFSFPSLTPPPTPPSLFECLLSSPLLVKVWRKEESTIPGKKGWGRGRRRMKRTFPRREERT